MELPTVVVAVPGELPHDGLIVTLSTDPTPLRFASTNRSIMVAGTLPTVNMLQQIAEG
jgi:hypothetical protein